MYSTVCQTYKLTPQATWLQMCFWHKLPFESSEGQIYHPQLRLEAIEGIKSTSDLGEKKKTHCWNESQGVTFEPWKAWKKYWKSWALLFSNKNKPKPSNYASTYLQQTFNKLMKIQTLHWITSLCCTVDKLCLTLCNPRYCSMPGFLIHHYLTSL